MIKIPSQTPIEFLIQRKYPVEFAMVSDAKFLVAQYRDAGRLVDEATALARVTEYKAQLEAMPANEIAAMELRERMKLAAEIKHKQELEERERYFNQPRAKADFDYWSKMPHWTLDEAIALSFGRAPEVVSWERLQSMTQISPFAAEYARVRELAMRAVPWKKLYDPVTPSIFLGWAKETGVSVADELLQAVNARGILVTNWKEKFEKLQTQLERINAVAEDQAKTIAAQRQAIETRDQTIASLTTALDELRQAEPDRKSPDIGTRERDSVLKIIAAFLTDSYKPAELAQPHTIAKDLASTLQASGLSLSDDTIVKWVKAAAEVVPNSPKKSK